MSSNPIVRLRGHVVGGLPQLSGVGIGRAPYKEPYEMSIEWEVNRQPFSSGRLYIYRYAFAFILLGNINAKLKLIIVTHATNIAILDLIQWMWKILQSDNFFQPTTSENAVRKNKHMNEPYITVFRRYGRQGKSNMYIP